MGNNKQPIDICLMIIAETDNAFRVCVDDNYKTATWLPKSQVKMDQDGGVGDTVIFTMPEWLAYDKHFI